MTLSLIHIICVVSEQEIIGRNHFLGTPGLK